MNAIDATVDTFPSCDICGADLGRNDPHNPGCPDGFADYGLNNFPDPPGPDDSYHDVSFEQFEADRFAEEQRQHKDETAADGYEQRLYAEWLRENNQLHSVHANYHTAF